MKKIIALMLVALMMFSMVGCSSDNGGQAAGGSDEVTLTYAIWDKNQEPGMRAIADAFEAQNPGIKIQVEVTPWNEYWTKLEAAAQGGALPDVFWMHTVHFLKYAQGDQLMEVGSKVEADADVDYGNFPEGLVKIYELDGKNYAIPKDFDTIGLWYNKTMFDEKGVSYPDETWTWETFVEAAKTLTDEANGVYGFPAALDEQQGYANAIYQNGGFMLSEDRMTSGFDQQATKDAIQWWIDLREVEGVSPSLEQMAETNFGQMFESGKVAMVFQGSWMVTAMKNNEFTLEHADVAVLPMGSERASIYNGLGNVIAKNSEHPEEAWKFLKFMGTKEANILQAENGSAIPAFKDTQQPWIDFSPEFNLGVYVDMLDYGVPYPTSKTRPKWQQVMNDEMRRIFAGEVSVDEGCDKLADEMNKILAEQ